MTHPGHAYRFGDFTLDIAERQLRRGGVEVELSARYFDALALLVRAQGKLVSKDRFLADVWSGVPVTDEALTQCIKTLRRQLGDDVGNPRYIETVPKHGYRFIADAHPLDDDRPPPGEERRGWDAGTLVVLTGAGTLGGGVAGIAGGLLYGLGGANQPLEAGMGAASVLLVLLSLNILAGLAGGLGVSFGMAVAFLRGGGPWIVLGGALGGLLVGGAVKLLGVDAFNLFLGHAPAGITGGPEGAILGAFVALGAWLGGAFRTVPLPRPVLAAGLGGAAAGLLIPLLGGRLMGGSLELLAHSFAGSRLRLDPLGRLVGEAHFGLASQMVFGAAEGALFGMCVVGAIVLAERSRRGFAARPA